MSLLSDDVKSEYCIDQRLTYEFPTRVTHWGTSPKFLTTLKQHGLPAEMNLESLQHVGTAGSPLSIELHEWFAANFPKSVGLFSGSGGTDLVGGSELLPVSRSKLKR